MARRQKGQGQRRHDSCRDSRSQRPDRSRVWTGKCNSRRASGANPARPDVPHVSTGPVLRWADRSSRDNRRRDRSQQWRAVVRRTANTWCGRSETGPGASLLESRSPHRNFLGVMDHPVDSVHAAGTQPKARRLDVLVRRRGIWGGVFGRGKLGGGGIRWIWRRRLGRRRRERRLVTRRNNVVTPETFVGQLRRVLPTGVRSVVLYGSAVAGDHLGRRSDYNVLIVLERVGVAELKALSAPTKAWVKAGNHPPNVFTLEGLQKSAHAFPIELLDIRDAHRILFGDDVLPQINVRDGHLRTQIDHELKG